VDAPSGVSGGDVCKLLLDCCDARAKDLLPAVYAECICIAESLDELGCERERDVIGCP
jgi:hypothetical protein